MDASTITAIIAAAGVVLSAWMGFLGNKKGTLANAEKDFRELILRDNENLRKRVDELEKVTQELSKENTILKARLEENNTEN